MAQNNYGFWEKYKWLFIAGILFLVIILIWIVYPIVLYASISTPNQGKTWAGNIGDVFGTYGDSFGALNTLFSGLAFCGVIYSVIMQTQELKLTREEFKGQREEFEKQNEILENQRIITEQQQKILKEQHEELMRQNIANQFFSLMEERRQKIYQFNITVLNPEDYGYRMWETGLIDSASIKYFSGYSVFTYYHKNFNNLIGFIPARFLSDRIPEGWINLNESTDEIFTSHFALLVVILDFLDKSNTLLGKSNYLFNILMSNFHTHELTVLFWAGFVNDEIKLLIEKHSLLANLTDYEILDVACGYYKKDVFGCNNAVADEVYEVYENSQSSVLPPTN